MSVAASAALTPAAASSIDLTSDAASVSCRSPSPDLALTLSKFLRPSPSKDSKPPRNLDEASTTLVGLMDS